VLVLSNGDFLLTGPREVDATNPWRDRHQRFEMFVLDRSLTKPPVALGEFIRRRAAVSRTRLHISWTPPGSVTSTRPTSSTAAECRRSRTKRLVISYGRPPDE